MDLTILKNEARTQFVAVLKDKVSHIASEKCWIQNIKYSLEEMNDIVRAAVEFEVTDTKPFTKEEIEAMAKSVRSLRILKMQGRVQDLLVSELTKKGVDPTIFKSSTSQ